ncbi:hypothetical protein F511_41818 [Dorcoceras hygrometricum]|uniref:Uncharacterized protein n=1 Tax=Dorcoceras hygrometricum TaxID=472368 RepID=A0A2Z6ZZJ1_9LAMI|nr:hypothetical protein F511_41818 [Dorcoceras hygrometricum]
MLRSDQSSLHVLFQPKSRPLGNTETSWCRAAGGGTGIAVLALQLNKPTTESSHILQITLEKILNSHPILHSKLHYNPATKQFSFLKTGNPGIPLKFHDSSSTSKLLLRLSTAQNSGTSPLLLISEHELNSKSWSDPNSFPCSGMDLLFGSVYALSDVKSVVVLKFHAAICDRTTAVSFLRELMVLAKEGEGGGGASRTKIEGEGDMGIESLVPSGLAKKTIWAHGIDMLGYSVNSLRLTNLNFKNTQLPRFSEIIRLKINAHCTANILTGCKSRGIKLCGALAAAGLMAGHSTKSDSAQKLKKKYGVVTLTDCRTIVEPALSTQHFGFYHSAILNTQTMKGTENFWSLAQRCFTDFEQYKKCNRHFSDMADLNYLMCKAIENPSLTASSSLRTSLISVFEDPVMDGSGQMQQDLGVEDYIGCASLHGVGPSIAFFDTIRDGELDCACVYPAPLHSREQMSEFVDRMRRIMIQGGD